MTEQAKALGILSIARKARKIELGEEPVTALARQGRARLVLVASDAGEATKRKAERLVSGTRQQLLTVPFDKAALGGAMGWSDCAVAAFADISLAAAFVKALQPAEPYAELLERLEAKQARFRKRAGTKKKK